MSAKWLTAMSIAATTVMAVLVMAIAPRHVLAADPVETGRFVWHDLMARDVGAARKFYGELLGWRFEDTRRGDRSYVLASSAAGRVAGIVDISAMANAGQQWLSFMAVDDVNKSAAQVRSDGGKILVEPRDIDGIGRAAVVADPQGAPLGLAQLLRNPPDPQQPIANHFFWQEYLARDAAQALDFYKRLAAYESAITDSRLGIEYHVLRKTRGRAGLFQLPATVVDVEPNWLPYVFVSDPATVAARVPGLGGRIVVAARPDLRNGSLVVIADPGGAVLALQKYPF